MQETGFVSAPGAGRDCHGARRQFCCKFGVCSAGRAARSPLGAMRERDINPASSVLCSRNKERER
ncbi:hypothetical protein A2U01_0083497, partial [Trifolium medium]|nr:hypothetical protein [Trifolium medium]